MGLSGDLKRIIRHRNPKYLNIKRAATPASQAQERKELRNAIGEFIHKGGTITHCRPCREHHKPKYGKARCTGARMPGRGWVDVGKEPEIDTYQTPDATED